MDLTLLRKPSAWIPVGMSIAALALVLGYVAIYGIARGGDEDAAAHIWQLLMVGQLPFVAYFALKWVWAAPGKGVLIVLLQIAAGIGALAPVYLLRL